MKKITFKEGKDVEQSTSLYYNKLICNKIYDRNKDEVMSEEEEEYWMTSESEDTIERGFNFDRCIYMYIDETLIGILFDNGMIFDIYESKIIEFAHYLLFRRLF